MIHEANGADNACLVTKVDGDLIHCSSRNEISLGDNITLIGQRTYEGCKILPEGMDDCIEVTDILETRPARGNYKNDPWPNFYLCKFIWCNRPVREEE